MAPVAVIDPFETQLPIGTVIAGKYEIVAVIGTGGSATVYRARKVGMRLEVALKVMHGDLETDEDRERFLREAEIIKKLQHAHVVRVLDYGHTHEGVPFLVLSLLQGRTLDERLEREGALSDTETARISLQVLRALEQAHSLKIVHRDIKPANIFLQRAVLGDVVQVLDFGLAKLVVDARDSRMALTSAGAVLGTPRYMAPEQVRGEEVGQGADIYAMGLVMAEMICGKPIIDGKTEMEIYVAQGSDRPVTLPRVVVDSPFAAIVQRATDKTVSVRYRLASQMLADVTAVARQLAGGSEIDAVPDLDETKIVDPSKAYQALRLPTDSSEKLRNAFNVLARKQASDPEEDGAATQLRREGRRRSEPPPFQDDEDTVLVRRPLAFPGPNAGPHTTSTPSIDVVDVRETVLPELSEILEAEQLVDSEAEPIDAQPIEREPPTQPRPPLDWDIDDEPPVSRPVPLVHATLPPPEAETGGTRRALWLVLGLLALATGALVALLQQP
jgi:serine/threonine protein kinase